MIKPSFYSKYLRFIGLLLLSSVVFGQKSPKTYSITEFGAVADGKTMNTQAIQKAIDRAALKGGIVEVPAGVFVTGTFFLKSNVSLHLADGAQLLGSLNIFDYQQVGHSFALIICQNQQQVGISGKGIIDGRGRELALAADSLYHLGIYDDPDYNYYRTRLNRRPKIIEFLECKQVTIIDVTIKNSASWVQSYIFSEEVTIDGITVDSDEYWNNDGIDIQDSKNVRITNCYVNAADDGICLKSEHPDRMNENIYIAHCTVRSSASAVKFGTASFGGFMNVKIENIKVFDTYRSAIAIESVDGGRLENVEVSNIEAKNTGNAIFIRLGQRNEEGPVGTLKNIRISHVRAEIPFDRPDRNYEVRGPDLPFFHNPFPGSVAGIPGHPVENVVLEDIEIIYPGRSNKGMAYIPVSRLTQVTENEAGYPEFSMFGELPSWAFYMRHVSGLVLQDVRVSLREADFRPAYVFDDVQNLKLEKLKIDALNGAKDQVILHQTELEDAVDIKIEGRDDDGLLRVETTIPFRKAK